MSTTWEMDGRFHDGLHQGKKKFLYNPEFSVNYNLKTLIVHFFFSILYVLGMTGAQVIHMLGQNYRLPRPSNCPEQFYSIMMECWNVEPKQRPTFETLHWKLEDYFEPDSSYSDTNNFIN